MPRLLTLLAAFALVLPFSAQAGGVAKPAVKIENPDTQCVAPADEMRLGERGAKVSLNGCIECHASKTNGSVTGTKENFCEACHSYAAVKLDCWDCHQPKAGYKATAATLPSGDHK